MVVGNLWDLIQVTHDPGNNISGLERDGCHNPGCVSFSCGTRPGRGCHYVGGKEEALSRVIIQGTWHCVWAYQKCPWWHMFLAGHLPGRLEPRCYTSGHSGWDPSLKQQKMGPLRSVCPGTGTWNSCATRKHHALYPGSQSPWCSNQSGGPYSIAGHKSCADIRLPTHGSSSMESFQRLRGWCWKGATDSRLNLRVPQAHCKTYRKTFAMMTLAINSFLILLSVMLLSGHHCGDCPDSLVRSLQGIWNLATEVAGRPIIAWCPCDRTPVPTQHVIQAPFMLRLDAVTVIGTEGESQ